MKGNSITTPMNNKFIFISIFFICLPAGQHVLYASNLANPVQPISGARMALGVSYHIGGYTITNRKLPCLINRFHGRISYAPFTYFNLGIDLGASQMEVASDTTLTGLIQTFHGNYGFSFGAYIKVSSPLIRNIMGFIGILQGTQFKSENSSGAYYKGPDLNGAVGLLFRIRKFAYIAAGAEAYLIDGKNKSYNSDVEMNYSNVNNVRGWIAFDITPPMKNVKRYIPYLTVEVSLSPEVTFNKKAPMQEISFSISIGSVTKRLYGKKTLEEEQQQTEEQNDIERD
jgi:hypothetical protein